MLNKTQGAVIAVNRFGLGAKPGELKDASQDPQAWLLAQMRSPAFDSKMGNIDSAYGVMRAHNRLKKARKEQIAKGNDDAMMAAKPVRDFAFALVKDGFQQSVDSDASFNIRLLDFFSNHFSVSAVNQPMRVLAPLLERDAIAPNLVGRFEDMLLAVEQHPAMLRYLNNEKSFGPQSVLGRKREKGINENLAREILELHTLGVGGGYQLADIQELAKAISGWSMAGINRGNNVGFVFRATGHEPGSRKLLDKAYRQKGVQQGEAMLRDLARMPQTAGFVSFKLAQHFISDKPPPALVAAMEKAWLKTEGDLQAVISTMVKHPESWRPEQQKFKTPREFVVSTLRAGGTSSLNARKIISTLTNLGQRPFNAGSPVGYSALTEAWSGSDALMKRIDWAASYSSRIKQGPIQLAEQSFADQLSNDTRRSIMRAENRQQGLALLLLSPEFQRR